MPAVVLTVTTDEQGGSAVASTSTTVGGTLADPGSPARAGFRFEGWFASPTGGTAIVFPYAHGQSEDFALYAQWSVSDCANGGSCRVGETGPGGGIIFYAHDDADDYFTSTGSDCGNACRYLEAEPTIVRTARWCDVSTGLGVTSGALGHGMSNTITARSTCTAGAIYIAAEFESNGLADWHLPSFDELALLYARRDLPGLAIGSPAVYYWSSTEFSGGGSNGSTARTYRFHDGATNVSFSKTGFSDATSPRIHLVRAFGPSSVTVTTDEQGGSTVDSVTAPIGGDVSDPGAPTRDGFVFDGWFTSPTGGTKVSFPYAHGGTTDFALYAQWTPTCAGGGACVVGDIGPGGGIVFYVHDDADDDMFTSVGSACGSSCRYLEAAPSDQGSGVWATSTGACYSVDSDDGNQFCTSNFSIYPGSAGQAASREASVEIGMGMANTNQIYSRLTAYAGVPTSDYASGIAWSYTNNGKSDWHLPSKDELNQMWVNRAVVPGLQNAYYSMSSERDAFLTWAQALSTGTVFPVNKHAAYLVRPVRAF